MRLASKGSLTPDGEQRRRDGAIHGIALERIGERGLQCRDRGLRGWANPAERLGSREADIEFVVEECGRCSVGGVITHFSHVHAGVCFECSGKGHGKPLAGGVDGAREVVRKRLLAAAARARRAERDAEATRALGTVWAGEHPELAVALTAVAERIQVDEEFGWSVHTALVSFAGTVARGEALTVKQTEFAQSLVAELAADVAAEAAKAEVDAAKVHLGQVGEALTVTGTVRVNMSIESTFG